MAEPHRIDRRLRYQRRIPPMKGKLKWAVAVAVALAGGAVVLVFLRTPSDAAQHAGRDLTEWVRDAESTRRKFGQPDPAAQGAILSILTNHCDTVLRRMRNPTQFEQQKIHLRSDLPASIKKLPPVAWVLEESAGEKRRHAAGWAFAFSRPAVKVVVAQLEQFSSPTNSLSMQAVQALGPIGTAEAEDALLRVLTNRAHPYRLEAMYCFRAFGYYSEQVTGTMTALLSDPDPDVRSEAEGAVAYYKKSQTGK